MWELLLLYWEGDGILYCNMECLWYTRHKSTDGSKERSIMYARKTQSWMKHIDFILLDMLCLHVAFILAYMTRIGISNPYGDREYLVLAALITLVNGLVLIANRTMQDVLKRGFYKEMAKTVQHVFYVFALTVLCIFAVKESATYSRIALFLMAGYYLLISYGVRLLWKRFLMKKKQELGRAAVYFITVSDRAEQVMKRFFDNNIISRTVQGMCILDEDRTGTEICGIPVTASAETIVKHLCQIWVDEVFVSLPASYPQPTKLLSAMAEMGIVVHLEMEDLGSELWQHQVIEEFAGVTVRTFSMTMATPFQAVLKRTLDICGGLVGCVITGLLTLVIGPMIYIKSPGPIFFKQTRVGKNGKKFQMYKFRSMYLDAEARKAELMAQNRVQGNLMFKLEYDPRIIGSERLPDGTIKKGIGNFIRDYSLDEFPQFLNVLKGDLSLVGTRPPTIDEWEQYELHHHARLAIKPGITGMWQVSGRSNITDFEQVVELDKKYIREWSMGLDFRILLQTVKVVLGKDGSM